MKRNYKLHKNVTGAGDRCRCGKENHKLNKRKGSHGLHQDFFTLQTMTALIKSFCGGVKNEGWKGRMVEGEKLRILKMRLKASKPFLHENSNALYDYRHFAAFSADSVHLKKPSGGPKGLIGPPCHGAPWPPEAK
jgi:hypothetical protein